MLCLSGFGIRRRRGVRSLFMVFVTRGTFNVVCPRFPHRPSASVRPSNRRTDRPRGRGHRRGAALADAGAGQRREAVIRVAAKSKFKSNPYLHLSPCRRQNPPCFHIKVRAFNHVTVTGIGHSVHCSPDVQRRSSLCLFLFGGPMKILSVLTIRLALALHAFLRAQTIHSFRSATRESKRR